MNQALLVYPPRSALARVSCVANSTRSTFCAECARSTTIPRGRWAQRVGVGCPWLCCSEVRVRAYLMNPRLISGFHNVRGSSPRPTPIAFKSHSLALGKPQSDRIVKFLRLVAPREVPSVLSRWECIPRANVVRRRNQNGNGRTPQARSAARCLAGCARVSEVTLGVMIAAWGTDARGAVKRRAHLGCGPSAGMEGRRARRGWWGQRRARLLPCRSVAFPVAARDVDF